jgi:hypothetical protein
MSEGFAAAQRPLATEIVFAATTEHDEDQQAAREFGFVTGLEAAVPLAKFNETIVTERESLAPVRSSRRRKAHHPANGLPGQAHLLRSHFPPGSSGL